MLAQALQEQLIEDANLDGEIWIVTDNLSSHNSVSTRAWFEEPYLNRT
ncbi:hypothetical protein [Streptomyces mirabilis]